jgi:hypothetical protein
MVRHRRISRLQWELFHDDDLFCVRYELIIVKFFDHEANHLIVFTRLVKFCPERMTPTVIWRLFIALSEYGEQNDSEKFRNLIWLTGILKALSIPAFFMDPDIRKFLFKGGLDCFFYSYYRIVILLSSHREISIVLVIRRYLLKFVHIFPRETVDVFFVAGFPMKVFSFLAELIQLELSHTLFSNFVDALMQIEDYCTLPLGIFEIVESLTSCPTLAADDRLSLACDHAFDFLFNIIDGPQSQIPDGLPILGHIAHAQIAMLANSIAIPKVISLSRIFLLPFFVIPM